LARACDVSGARGCEPVAVPSAVPEGSGRSRPAVDCRCISADSPARAAAKLRSCRREESAGRRLDRGVRNRAQSGELERTPGLRDSATDCIGVGPIGPCTALLKGRGAVGYCACTLDPHATARWSRRCVGSQAGVLREYSRTTHGVRVLDCFSMVLDSACVGPSPSHRSAHQEAQGQLPVRSVRDPAAR
jgi:hypothetical protein